MAFTAKDVALLREKTSCGMMDCKKALTQADGDMEKAIELLREQGLAKAVKKAGRIAAEGTVCAKVSDSGVGAVVEVNSETDFVAKNTDFKEFVENVTDIVIDNDPVDVESLKELKMGEFTVAEALQDKVLSIGENIQIRRFVRYNEETVNVCYTHMGGNIGVMVGMAVSDNIRNNAEVLELGKDVGMQVAAMRPSFLDKADVDAETLENERKVLLSQAIEENKSSAKPKPEAIIERMVDGRIGKYYEENCLLQQTYVKDNKFTVEKHVAEVAKTLGGDIKIVKYVRFEKGEGIEKRKDDFAAEIASMVK